VNLLPHCPEARHNAHFFLIPAPSFFLDRLSFFPDSVGFDFLASRLWVFLSPFVHGVVWHLRWISVRRQGFEPTFLFKISLEAGSGPLRLLYLLTLDLLPLLSFPF